MDCLFCKIVNGEVPSKKIYEDDLVIAILDAYPNCDGHTLIIPKKHYTDFTEIDDELLIHINKIKKELTKKIIERIKPKCISFQVNYLEGQVIKHYHLHIMPNPREKVKFSTDEMFNKLK